MESLKMKIYRSRVHSEFTTFVSIFYFMHERKYITYRKLAGAIKDSGTAGGKVNTCYSGGLSLSPF